MRFDMITNKAGFSKREERKERHMIVEMTGPNIPFGPEQRRRYEIDRSRRGKGQRENERGSPRSAKRT